MLEARKELHPPLIVEFAWKFLTWNRNESSCKNGREHAMCMACPCLFGLFGIGISGDTLRNHYHNQRR